MNRIEQYKMEEMRFDAREYERDCWWNAFNSDVTDEEIKACMVEFDVTDYEEMKEMMFEQYLENLQ